MNKKIVYCIIILLVGCGCLQAYSSKILNTNQNKEVKNNYTCKIVEEYIGIDVPTQPKIYKYEYLSNGNIKRHYHLEPKFLSKIQLEIFQPSSLTPQINIFTNITYNKDFKQIISYNRCDENLNNCKYYNTNSTSYWNEEKLYIIDNTSYKMCDADKCQYDTKDNITEKIYYKDTLIAQHKYTKVEHDMITKYTYKYDQHNNIIEVCSNKWNGCNKIKLGVIKDNLILGNRHISPTCLKDKQFIQIDWNVPNYHLSSIFCPDFFIRNLKISLKHKHILNIQDVKNR